MDELCAEEDSLSEFFNSFTNMVSERNANSAFLNDDSNDALSGLFESRVSGDRDSENQEAKNVSSTSLSCVFQDFKPNNDFTNLNVLNNDIRTQSIPSSSHNDSSLQSGNFKVNTQSIPSVPIEQQDEELLNLGVSVYDQTEFENEVMGQVDKAIKEEEESRRKGELERDLKAVSDDIRLAKQRLAHIDKALAMAPKDEKLLTTEAKREVIAIKKEQDNKNKQLRKLQAKLQTLRACATGKSDEMEKYFQNDADDDQDMDEETKYHLEQVFSSKETNEEHLIRTGQMTPFGTVLSSQGHNIAKVHKIQIPVNEPTEFDKFLMEQVESHQHKKMSKLHPRKILPPDKKLKMFVSRASELGECSGSFPERNAGPLNESSLIPLTRPKIQKSPRKRMKLGSEYATGIESTKRKNRSLVENYKSDSEISDFETVEQDDCFSGSDQDYIPKDNLSDESNCNISTPKSKKSSVPRTNCKTAEWVHCKKGAELLEEDSSDSDYKPKKCNQKQNMKTVDDGCQKSYIKRIQCFEKVKLLKKQQRILENNGVDPEEDGEKYVEFEGDFRIPCSSWNKLYSYQQTGVRWLWELHQQNCGGIVGDEMGLGKTIQIIAFLIGLKTSDVCTDGDNFQGLGPVVLVCPATVMHQWVKEFHTWWPPFRVAILHDSGSFTGSKETLVRSINKNKGILITSYAGIVLHQQHILDCEWHYIILDEGHKIRNPNAQATLVAKQFRTQHRIILSGSPVQNNLKELWSLFDFIFPGKLGTLPVFLQQFSVPIVQGGYANASQVQVQTAYKCATVLRDTIKPYLLRRMKADVKMSIQLPNKSEQVLFCQLSEEQMKLYKDYIASPEIVNIINGKLQIFVGLTNLRKICNHPDIFTGGPKIFKNTDISTLSEDMHYGYYKRSGKMIVIEALLSLWHKQGHRVLLFTQSRQMMDVLERFVKSRNYTYMKMDGTTSISSRQPAISKFNSDSSIFVFLLTTRVGGIGVNLTGANRVVIYDPDWNPSTDTQARERAWRIGQEKQVTIYRLLTAGTIEEKIYHRQIFKQFVTNRVLKDPRQRRFFKSNDLYELFTFSELGKQGTETSAIFAGTGSEVKPLKRLKTKRDPGAVPKMSEVEKVHKNKKEETCFSAEKLESMKVLAKKLNLKFGKKKLEGVAGDGETSLDLENKTVYNSDCGVSNASNSNELDKDASTSHVSFDNVNLKAVTLDKCVLQQEKHKAPKYEAGTKHHKRKRKSEVVEGEEIDFLVKKDVYRSSQDSDEEKANAKQDDYVLSKLFKKSGVHTALKHDVIVDAADPDYMLVEGEANRVAKEAVKALKVSRRLCARAQEGIPTWTGTNGYCGSPQGFVKPRFGVKKKVPVHLELSSSSSVSVEESIPGPSTSLLKTALTIGKKKNEINNNLENSILSSRDLLAAIKKRKNVFASAQDEDSDGADDPQMPVKQSATESDELLVEIRNFIAFKAKVDGQAGTQELLEAFREKLPRHQTPIFKSLLGRICEFSRNASGEGVWFLKSEFR